MSTQKETTDTQPEDSKHIPGIYNYCDRWCERCPFTSRCLNFEMSEEKFGDLENTDITNEVFWQRLGETFQETLGMLKEMALEKGIDLDKIDSMAIVGLAAGTTARQASIVYPDILIDGYEIDPKIVQVGYDYFGMDLPNLNVYIQDGRWGLNTSKSHYDIISVDAYRPPYIPWHFTTREFFSEVYDHLEPDGVMVINIGRGLDDRRLINALGSTILEVFPSSAVDWMANIVFPPFDKTAPRMKSAWPPIPE